MNREKRVVLGLSGGVDSAVCAALLREQGYEVTGLYLENGVSPDGARDAAAVAERLGAELLVQDIRAELEEKVCAPFEAAYRAGQTPNPCILCNPTVKFKALLACADRLDAQFIATGHYARTENGALCKGRPANDQSYMLCRLLPEQVQRLLLPLGGYEKAEVRALAERFGIPVAHKPDSMEICFIPDKNYVNWLSARSPLPQPGNFVFHGAVIGTHEGIHRYTVGQRRPGLVDGRKVYISRIDAERNEIELALWEELFRTEVRARDFNWLIEPPIARSIPATIRVRHTKWEEPPCMAEADAAGGMTARCETPVRAPAAGQSAVLYAGERVLGGGFIV